MKSTICLILLSIIIVAIFVKHKKIKKFFTQTFKKKSNNGFSEFEVNLNHLAYRNNNRVNIWKVHNE